MSEENIVGDVPEVNQAEQDARQFGWVPEDEFKGNPDDWRDAETFLKRGKEINGFLRKDFQKVQEKLAARDLEIAEIREAMEEFRKYHNETEARTYKRALEDLKKQKIEAIEQGDGERVLEIEDNIDAIKEAQTKPAPKETATQSGPSQKDYFDWAKTNTWYVTDPELKAVAELYGQELNTFNPELKGRAFLDEITKQVKENFPEKFENKNRQFGTVGSSSDGRAPGGLKNKRGYNDLPAEAKAACDKFVKQKLMTQAQYLAEYQWD